MGETLSTPEVAHAIGHHHGKTKAEKHAERIEILEAILLAMVAVATAWSGYQTARSGDHYLRNTVLLATVLFLTALSQKFKVTRVRLGLIALSGCLLAVALYYVTIYPVA